MKNWNVNDWVKMILVATVFVVLVTVTLGIVFSNTPANEYNTAIRTKLVELLFVIVGALIVGSRGNDKKE